MSDEYTLEDYKKYYDWYMISTGGKPYYNVLNGPSPPQSQEMEETQEEQEEDEDLPPGMDAPPGLEPPPGLLLSAPPGLLAPPGI